MNKISALEIFISVADNNSFARAAEKLERSPSSVTKTISHLEAKVGVELFARSTRSIMLTEAGKLYLATAKNIVASLQDTAEAVAQLKGEIRGELRIISPVAYGNAFLADVCSTFLEKYPEVKLSVTLSDEQVNLNEGGYDLALSESSNDGCITRTFGNNLLYLCASPKYLARMTQPVLPEYFDEHEWLTFTHPLLRYRFLELQKDGQSFSVPLPAKTKIESNSYDFLLRMAANGIGLLAIPHWYFSSFLAEGKFIKVMEDYRILPTPFSQELIASYPQHRRATQKIMLFLEHLENHLKQQYLS